MYQRMNNHRLIEWILRIAVFGEFVGHGVFALQGKEEWILWIRQMIGVDMATATQLLTLIGVLDVVVGLIVLIRPVPLVLLWAAAWGFWTALVRPLVGKPVWDFLERWANWGAPLALFYLQGGALSGYWKRK